MAMAKDRSGRRPWGGLEDEVLATLWAAPGPVPRPRCRPARWGSAYGTITTILGRLRAKGLVIRTQIGRTYEYAPAQDAASHTASRMHSLMISRGDRAEVLARFVSELSAEEEQLLHAVLRDITQDDPASDGHDHPEPSTEHATEPAER